ncbi:heat shock factor protein HSF24-like [Salvia divinorum]|uniref:Heat shock factor protein HSF24-like n=1 Tax=Salvia divinorum TaxID=28513 RepID=A0ABD1I889_SALDI
MAQRSVPAPFLTKTYHLVDDPASDDVISWNEAGTAFVVWKTAEFAKDLLPNYFKHNNFSSFVRQLNTYGFRKSVPDKWEFVNENFKRGQKVLLAQIRRRKTAIIQNPANGKGAASDNETSGEYLGSSSTSSPNSKNLETQATAQLSDLSGENEKLRKDNQLLSSKLAQTKKQCDELIAFLTQSVKVAPDQISRIMNLGADTTRADGHTEFDDNDDDDDNGDENENCLKLFGVVVNKKKQKKRGCTADLCGPHKKQMRPWMESNKVCN